MFDFCEALANGIGRADEGLFADAARGDVAPEGFAFGERGLIGFGDSAVEEHGAVDGVVIATNLIAMLFEDGELALKPFGVEVADVAGISVLCDEFERYLFAASADE